MPRCVQCGGEELTGSLFCPRCGAPLTLESEKDVLPARRVGAAQMGTDCVRCGERIAIGDMIEWELGRAWHAICRDSPAIPPQRTRSSETTHEPGLRFFTVMVLIFGGVLVALNWDDISTASGHDFAMFGLGTAYVIGFLAVLPVVFFGIPMLLSRLFTGSWDLPESSFGFYFITIFAMGVVTTGTQDYGLGLVAFVVVGAIYVVIDAPSGNTIRLEERMDEERRMNEAWSDISRSWNYPDDAGHDRERSDQDRAV